MNVALIWQRRISKSVHLQVRFISFNCTWATVQWGNILVLNVFVLIAWGINLKCNLKCNLIYSSQLQPTCFLLHELCSTQAKRIYLSCEYFMIIILARGSMPHYCTIPACQQQCIYKLAALGGSVQPWNYKVSCMSPFLMNIQSLDTLAHPVGHTLTFLSSPAPHSAADRPTGEPTHRGPPGVFINARSVCGRASQTLTDTKIATTLSASG